MFGSKNRDKTFEIQRKIIDSLLKQNAELLDRLMSRNLGEFKLGQEVSNLTDEEDQYHVFPGAGTVEDDDSNV